MTTSTPSAFAALGLRKELVAAVTGLGYEEPTPVQRETIPLLIAGRDVLGQAATGTGKTAAFALPMLHRLAEAPGGAKRTRGLVLVPTRELAMQVAEAIHKYARGVGIELGYALRNTGQYAEALRAYEQALRLRPNYPEALEYLGEAYVKLGRLDEARAILERLKPLDVARAQDLEVAIRTGR